MPTHPTDRCQRRSRAGADSGGRRARPALLPTPMALRVSCVLPGWLAQLVRAPVSHTGGHRFESCTAHSVARAAEWRRRALPGVLEPKADRMPAKSSAPAPAALLKEAKKLLRQAAKHWPAKRATQFFKPEEEVLSIGITTPRLRQIEKKLFGMVQKDWDAAHAAVFAEGLLAERYQEGR